MARCRAYFRRLKKRHSGQAKMRSTHPPMPPGASHMAQYIPPARATPAELAASRDRVLNSTTPFIKEEPEDDDAPTPASGHTALAIRTATPQVESSAAHTLPERTSATLQDDDTEPTSPDTMGLEHALDTLDKLPADHKLVASASAFILEQKLVGTAFVTPSSRALKTTTQWVRNGLKSSEMADDRKEALAKVVRNTEANHIANWIKSAIRDPTTIRSIAAILGQDDVEEQCRDIKTTAAKRTHESHDVSFSADERLTKRPRTDVSATAQGVTAVEPTHQRIIFTGDQILNDALASSHDLRQSSPPLECNNGDFAAACSQRSAVLPQHHSGISLPAGNNAHGAMQSTVADCSPRPDTSPSGVTNTSAIAEQRDRASSMLALEPRPTVVKFVKFTPAAGNCYAYLPIDTPDMPINSPSTAEVEAACQQAVDKGNTLVWAKKLGPRFWVARFDLRTYMLMQVEGRVVSLGGLRCRLEHLPQSAPRTFAADLTFAMAVTSSDFMEALRAACPPKCPLPRVLELTPSDGPVKRVFHIHFQRPPGFLRLYIPILNRGSQEYFMATVAHMRSARICELCRKQHKLNHVCPLEEEHSWLEETDA
ncbi:hypothetical protein TI39_contig259g00010 [Zymoseptoria brevis]|uniref:Uncharacterized protein n=1 Tax=Zymoseptoria brevis TaxID=1047168 RepID=A0A0F4H0U0_9PEZI|nr:hypothetical protein TI39_contig259g00010 [Zymoseptoria brevis]